MKERPILFSGPMVRAILDGRKTQTRRVVNRLSGRGDITEFGPSDTPGYDWHFRDKRALWNDVDTEYVLDRCPYGEPGDRLWVRESLTKRGEYIMYAADFTVSWLPWPAHWKRDYRPSIHMPREASRITLEITSIRVERLNHISNNDILREGIRSEACNVCVHYGGSGCDHCFGLLNVFRATWDSINATRGYGWEVTPPVWVIELRKVAR